MNLVNGISLNMNNNPYKYKLYTLDKIFFCISFPIMENGLWRVVCFNPISKQNKIIYLNSPFVLEDETEFDSNNNAQKALQEIQKYNHIRSDLDSYLYEVVEWGLGNRPNKPNYIHYMDNG